MVLVFILLGIFILLLTVTLLVLLSVFRIEIKNLDLSNINNENQKSIRMNNKEEKQNLTGYNVVLSLYLFNKIKWIFLNLNAKKMAKMYSKMHLEKIDLKKLEKDLKLEDLKIIKKLHAKISYLDLKIKFGLESPVITAFLVSIISSAISIFLPYFVIDLKDKNYKYIIQPIYQNQNLYKIQFSCIIQVKMVHIINVIFLFLKKRRSDLDERATSNRRSYGYSYE